MFLDLFCFMCIPGNFIFSPKICYRLTKSTSPSNKTSAPWQSSYYAPNHPQNPSLSSLPPSLRPLHDVYYLCSPWNRVGGWYIVRTQVKKTSNIIRCIIRSVIDDEQYKWVPRHASDPLHLCLTEQLRCEYTTIDPTSYQEVSPSYIITDAEYVVPFLNNQLHSSSAG